MTKTDAEKQAKVDEGYLAFERETALLVKDRERLFADAESLRFEIQLGLAELQADIAVSGPSEEVAA